MNEKPWKETIWWTLWSIAIIGQIIVGFLRYNFTGFASLRLLGGGIMIVGFALGAMGVSTLRKMGQIPNEERSRRFGVGTTSIVTSGIYGVVRHPQHLCWVFFHLALILIVQDWIIVGLFGVMGMISIYMQTRQDDQKLVEKFSEAYVTYMMAVPRMNLLLGIIRLVKQD